MPPPSTIEQDLEQFTPDPVLCDVAFPFCRTLYPMGFAVEVASNSEHVIQAASESWASYPQAFHDPPVRVHFGVAPGDSKLPVRSTIRSREHLMSIYANPDNFAICDLNAGFSYGWVTEPVAADHPLLRYRFLASTALTLVQHRSLAVIHSALIARNGSGVILCGESMSGKSTLAYACARAGWSYVSDDGTYLVRKDSGRYAIGEHHSIRFREDARQLFPELKDRLPMVRPNGKLGIEILTRELPIATVPGCPIDHIVFLNRNEPGPARLRPYPRDRFLETCKEGACYGAAEVRAEQLRSYERLAGAGIWELRYRDFDSAIHRLEQLVDSGG
jgi:hypothetical protein